MFEFFKKIFSSKSKVGKITKPVQKYFKYKARFEKNPKRTVKVTRNRLKKKIQQAPTKKIKNGVTAPVRRVKNEIRRAKRIKHTVLMATSRKYRLIEHTFEYAKISYRLISAENLFLEDKTNAQKDINVTTMEMINNKENFRHKTLAELVDINEVIMKELTELGVKSGEDMYKAVNDAEFRKGLIEKNSYETYLEHWRVGFFGYKETEDGITDDERVIIWNQILEDQPFEKFIVEKG